MTDTDTDEPCAAPETPVVRHHLSAGHSAFRRCSQLSLFGFVAGRETHSGARLLRGPLPSHRHSVRSLSRSRVLKAHSGCVNTISWHEEEDASLLISGSDDTYVHVWRAAADPQAVGGGPARLRPLASHLTGHTHNIFGAVFVPGSSAHRAVTCGADGEVRLHDLSAQHSELLLGCVGEGGREDMAFKLAFLPGQANAFVCTYQVTQASKAELSLQRARGSTRCLCLLTHPRTHLQDGNVRLFDLRLPASSGCGAQKVYYSPRGQP